MSEARPGGETCRLDDIGAPGAAARLNQGCFCIGPSLPDLHGDLASRLAREGTAGAGTLQAPLFSSLPVFVSDDDVQAMRRLIAAIESVVAHPEFQAAALADAPAVARQMPDVPGVLQGYDFHLTKAGPQLIEINTNAGGLMLVDRLLDALRWDGRPWRPAGDVPEAVWRMFDDVWRRRRGNRPLQRVAIVDDNPTAQHLHAEFVLFRQLFECRGVRADIVDAAALTYADGALRHAGEPVDLVYNRLTDFYLDDHPALRQAALADAVVLTPNPRAHALYASKRNLARLTDPVALGAWGVAATVVEVLRRGIPATEVVRPEHAGALWRRRKGLFFKPARGYGSRGSYRGDKLTRRAFESILGGDYVAQALVHPSGRAADPAEPGRTFKFDVRSYVYDGRELLKAARLYDGQTTNFRTPGGGFAPVIGLTGDGSCGAGPCSPECDV